ncbi:hypothetical protein [Halorussus litoreus]|uniref:hypothetical protein n=1 Tax=Halorussus litoreus TaxID=1710536 RepID=UPI001300304E|nr:hypothetical protein [Halorussus litoreus]
MSYTDGSESVATFADGTTTVTADPKPSVSLGSLDRWEAISGMASATDEYENLDSLRVEVDGETVAVSDPTVREREQLHMDRQRTLPFSHGDFEPGERYSVTVVATDVRGQTTEVSRYIVPVEDPEIVRSEFVNGPVDSYHERIDPSRYAAHHVLKVDLNGVDPENVTVETGEIGETIPVETDGYRPNQEYDADKDVITVETYWAGSIPGQYKVDSKFKVDSIESKNNEKDTFDVVPSKPELRLDVLNDGTEDYITREHGILVDASKSFDPDGTELKYIWKYGAEPTKPDNTTAKFGAYEDAASIVEDEHRLRTKRTMDFLSHFVPNLRGTAEITEGPYFPNETVRVRVETKAFHFSKVSYYDEFELGVDVSNSKAKLKKWQLVETYDSGHSNATEDAYQYVGIVEIPASELIPGSETPTITVYNRDNEKKTDQIEFRETNVLLPDKTYWANTTVQSLNYTVEKPQISEKTVESKEERDAFLEDGYSVETKRQETKHVLEERVKVQDAEYEQVEREFDSTIHRGMFLESRQGWYPGGTTQEEVARTRTSTSWYSASTAKWRTDWYDGDLWNGEYTGQSREVVVDSAEYQTQRQYQYEDEVQRTGTRTATRTRTVQVPHTGTRTVTHCIPGHGCYTTTTTYTYYATETRTYTTTYTYTYTVTRTETYWAPSRYASHHSPTGETRRVKIEDAEYETQYEIAEKEEYTKTVNRYVAARDKLVRPAQYEWQQRQSTTDSILARQLSSRDDWQIGESIRNTEWALRKQTGTTRQVTSQFENESRVVETSATVVGNRVQQYYNVETGKKVVRSVERTTEEKTFDGVRAPSEIRRSVTDNRETDDECELKGLC